MRILVDNSGYVLTNMGDVAMLQSGVSRLQQLWPGTKIDVLTSRAERLARYVPYASPVVHRGRDQFMARGAILGKLGKTLRGAEDMVRRSAPGFSGRVVAWRRRRRRRDWETVGPFVECFSAADLVVATGGGFVTDAFWWQAQRVLTTLCLASRMGKSTAMLGQGLGPITNPDLRALAAQTLGRLNLLTLREGTASLPLLGEMLVDQARVVVTGDDAIEVAYAGRSHGIGTGIGVNLRTTEYAGADEKTIGALRPALELVATRHGAPLVPIPISYADTAGDARALSDLLGRDVPMEDSVQSPQHAIASAVSCRVVVTGSYHAAVFALSVGVPVLGLAASQYYVEKFAGLGALFGDGCQTVRMDCPGWPDALVRGISAAWAGSEALRPELLSAARRQIASGRAAYRTLYDIVTGADA